MRTELRGGKRALVSHLEELRDLAGIGRDISVLRVLDVTAWMHGKGAGYQDLSRGDPRRPGTSLLAPEFIQPGFHPAAPPHPLRRRPRRCGG
ncbi:DUF6308 family protein [Streptomyces kronopolitis]|uniref:DUF6308 family protein n=1 Tax=Streptomyces kronopolitis TaxID=1612435 RepID=UPI003D999ECA